MKQTVAERKRARAVARKKAAERYADRKKIERHHRLPQSRGGTNHDDNISFVQRSYHQAFHHLFHNMTAAEIASFLTETWVQKDMYLVAIPRKKKKPTKKRQRMFCVDCQAEVLKHLPITHKGE
jgi:hypothetical protein